MPTYKYIYTQPCIQDTCTYIYIKLLYNNMSFVSVLGLEVYGNLNIGFFLKSPRFTIEIYR